MFILHAGPALLGAGDGIPVIRWEAFDSLDAVHFPIAEGQSLNFDEDWSHIIPAWSRVVQDWGWGSGF